MFCNGWNIYLDYGKKLGLKFLINACAVNLLTYVLFIESIFIGIIDFYLFFLKYLQISIDYLCIVFVNI